MTRRILLVSPAYYGYGDAYAGALRSLGYDVGAIFTGADRGRVARTREYAVREVLPLVHVGAAAATVDRAFNQRVLGAARRGRPDIVLVVKGESLQPETVAELARDSLLVHWAYDDPYKYAPVVASLGAYALIASFSIADTARLKADGYPALYLPLGYDPLVFGPRPEATLEPPIEVSFVGARYPAREALLAHVAQAADLGIWGGDWKRRPWRARYYRPRTVLDGCARGKADRAAANLIFQRSRINLNVHGPWDGLSMRLFEVPAAGGFQLCDVQPGVEEMFVPGKEIELFASAGEAVEKIRFYLAHDDARRKIAAAGRERAVREHTLAMRLATLLSAVEA